ncbi:MAG: tetratricopeptide repeat protein [Acidimicrobiales bacterium]
MNPLAEPAAARHLLVCGPTRAARERAATSLELGPALAAVRGHRRRRGPYTAAGSVLRAAAPRVCSERPELLAAADAAALLAAAPELASLAPNARQTLTSAAPPEERTRFYPGAYTRRTAHAVTELLSGLAQHSRTGACLLVEDADELDATDAQWLAIMLRRTDPAVLRVVLGARTPEALRDELRQAAGAHAELVRADASAPVEAPDGVRSPAELVHAYLAGDCTSDDPAERAAYLALGPAERAVRHDARAAELERCGEASLRLGAIPYHRELGSSADAAKAALGSALERCVLAGFYDAAVELGHRALALCDWQADPEGSWVVVAKLTTALTGLDRHEEAERLYAEACAQSTSPSVHLQAAYGRAMLYTRYLEPGRRDHQTAMAWINTAIAIASLLPEAQSRAFNLAFQENGRALVEMHLGEIDAALALVEAALDRLHRDLGPDAQSLHRSVLWFNHAQLLARAGRLDASIAEYGLAIAADPNHSEYHFERALLYSQRGDLDRAADGYDEAIRLSPHYPEPHYNRAMLALAVGDVDRALAELGYVLELEPDFLDARVNRAALLLELGALAEAELDVAAGLTVDPAHPHLLCVAAQLAAEAGQHDVARRRSEEALAVDPTFAAAWCCLGALSYAAGEFDAAAVEFTRALELGEDPAARTNRALALQGAGRWAEAIADYSEVLAVDADPELLELRAHCHAALGERGAADADRRAARRRRELAA